MVRINIYNNSNNNTSNKLYKGPYSKKIYPINHQKNIYYAKINKQIRRVKRRKWYKKYLSFLISIGITIF